MLEKKFIEVYDKFKLQFYRKIIEKVRERDGSLSAMEGFSLEIIHALGEPTVGQFADFLNISQSNATYKVNNLIKKYYSYAELMTDYELTVVGRMKERFSEEDIEKLNEMLTIISSELMPECE